MPFTLSTFKKSLKSAFAKIETSQAEALSIEIAANYVAGRTAGEKHKSTIPLNSVDPVDEDEGLTEEDKAEIALLVALFLGYSKGFNARAQAQILNTVKDMITAGQTTDEIKKYIDDVFEGKENIVIDNVGKKRKELYVDKDLKLSEVSKTITKPFVISVLSYASMTGENASHTAYEKGKEMYYRSIGHDQWVFVGPADERARAWHVALIGETFTWNTEQSNYAEQVLREPRCRHRSVPFYGDSRDTKKEVWDRLKEKNGLFWNTEKEMWDMKEV